MKLDIVKQIEERDEKLYGKKCDSCFLYEKFCRCEELKNFSFSSLGKEKQKFNFYFSINGNIKQKFAELSELSINLKPEENSQGTLLEFTDSSGNTFEISAEKQQ